MLKAIIRYLLFCVPLTFFRGLEFILFDKEEIIGSTFQVRDQYNKELEERRILLEHLERCRKQVRGRGK